MFLFQRTVASMPKARRSRPRSGHRLLRGRQLRSSVKSTFSAEIKTFLFGATSWDSELPHQHPYPE